MHKRSKSCEPYRKMEEHAGCGNGATSCDDSAAAAGRAPAAAQCSTVSVYLAKIGGTPRLVTAVWSKNLINQSFTVSIDRPGDDDAAASASHKVELKPWPF